MGDMSCRGNFHCHGVTWFIRSIMHLETQLQIIPEWNSSKELALESHLCLDPVSCSWYLNGVGHILNLLYHEIYPGRGRSFL